MIFNNYHVLIFKYYLPSVPQQNNSYDCGVFVCRFAYNIMLLHEECFTDEDLKDYLSTKISQSAAFAFDMECIKTFRSNMKTLISNLSELWKGPVVLDDDDDDDDSNEGEGQPLLTSGLSRSPKYSHTSGLRNLGTCSFEKYIYIEYVSVISCC